MKTLLDSLPLPDRSLTARYRQRYFGQWLKPLASVRTSLGCTSRCNFCALWSITGGKYLRRRPEAVVEEHRKIDRRWNRRIACLSPGMVAATPTTQEITAK